MNGHLPVANNELWVFQTAQGTPRGAQHGLVQLPGLLREPRAVCRGRHGDHPQIRRRLLQQQAGAG